MDEQNIKVKADSPPSVPLIKENENIGTAQPIGGASKLRRQSYSSLNKVRLGWIGRSGGVRVCVWLFY